MERRSVSGWCVLSALLVVIFFGLFFAFTERKSWPEQRTVLAPGNMRFAPRTSTFWCEGIDLRSQHPFVAYQVSGDPHISADTSSEREWNITLRGKNKHAIRQFLLPASTIEVVACPAQRLLLFRGEDSGESMIDDCLRYGWKKDSSESEEDDSSSEEVSDNPCSMLIWSSTLRADRKCVELRANVSHADTYLIVVLGRTASVSVKVRLHRSRYTVRRSGGTYHMCSLSSICTIGLSWGSTERALLWVPEEGSKSDFNQVAIYSWCRPRLALFALLSVMLPLVLFLAAALGLRRLRQRHLNSSRSQRAEPLIAPLPSEDPPPAYETLDDAPPPYSGLKHSR